MKSLKTTHIFCLLVLIINLLSAHPVRSQKKVENADRIQDYDYQIGRLIGRAAAESCSAEMVSIEGVAEREAENAYSPKQINLSLSANESFRFVGSVRKTEAPYEVTIGKPGKLYVGRDGLPSDWNSLLDLTPGKKAMIFRCGEGRGFTAHSFLTTDDLLFEKIRTAIALIERISTDDSELQSYFRFEYGKDSDLSKGVAIHYLLAGKLSWDLRALVCVGLLQERSANQQKEGWFITTIIESGLRTKYTAVGAEIDYRREAFRNLVGLANETGLNAVDATEILAWIARSNPDELRPFLKLDDVSNIRSNFGKLKQVNRVGIQLPEELMYLLDER